MANNQTKMAIIRPKRPELPKYEQTFQVRNSLFRSVIVKRGKNLPFLTELDRKG